MMMSYTVGGDFRERLIQVLDDLKAAVLVAFEEKKPITFHTHNPKMAEKPPGPDKGYLDAKWVSAMMSDFAHPEWTFGVSIGRYPRAAGHRERFTFEPPTDEKTRPPLAG